MRNTKQNRELEPGELTRIIIGTVVASGYGITSRQLTEKLNSWGIPVKMHHMSTRLYQLAEDGRIERVRCGLYRGV